jgi:hypothetical protein
MGTPRSFIKLWPYRYFNCRPPESFSSLEERSQKALGKAVLPFGGGAKHLLLPRAYGILPWRCSLRMTGQETFTGVSTWWNRGFPIPSLSGKPPIL